MLRAGTENRLLLTEDKDFGELAFRHGAHLPVPGIVLLRVASIDTAVKQARLEAAVRAFGEALHGRYTVIEDGRFRYRPLRRSVSENAP